MVRINIQRNFQVISANRTTIINDRLHFGFGLNAEIWEIRSWLASHRNRYYGLFRLLSCGRYDILLHININDRALFICDLIHIGLHDVAEVVIRAMHTINIGSVIGKVIYSDDARLFEVLLEQYPAIANIHINGNDLFEHLLYEEAVNIIKLLAKQWFANHDINSYIGIMVRYLKDNDFVEIVGDNDFNIYADESSVFNWAVNTHDYHLIYSYVARGYDLTKHPNETVANFAKEGKFYEVYNEILEIVGQGYGFTDEEDNDFIELLSVIVPPSPDTDYPAQNIFKIKYKFIELYDLINENWEKYWRTKALVLYSKRKIMIPQYSDIEIRFKSDSCCLKRA